MTNKGKVIGRPNKLLNFWSKEFNSTERMFVFLFALALSDSGDIDIVQSYIDENQYGSASEYATQCINRDGFLDAEIALFALRGQCYYQLGKYDLAIEDLTRAITSSLTTDKMKTDCYKYRGMSYFKTGLFQEAEQDAQNAHDKQLTQLVFECRTLFNSIDQHKSNGRYDLALLIYKDIIKKYITTIDTMVEAAQCALDAGLEDEFLEISSQAVEKEPSNLKVLEQRGVYFMCSGDYDFAKRHLLACAKKATGQCKCPTLNRHNNEFNKFYEKFNEAVNKSNAEDADLYANKCINIALQHCGNNTKLVHRSEALIGRSIALSGKPRKGISYLDELIEKYPNSTELLIGRGEIEMAQEDYDAADKDFQLVKKLDERNERADEAIAHIFDIREQERRCDYYKLLNLSHDFTPAQLKDAYRKASRLYHPDQYSDPIKKKECEKKMVQVNRANEILGNPSKRAIYDAGEDPDNPGAIQQQEKMRKEREEEELRRKQDKEKAQKKSKQKAEKQNTKTKTTTTTTAKPINLADYHIGTDPFGLGGNPWDL